MYMYMYKFTVNTECSVGQKPSTINSTGSWANLIKSRT